MAAPRHIATGPGDSGISARSLRERHAPLRALVTTLGPVTVAYVLGTAPSAVSSDRHSARGHRLRSTRPSARCPPRCSVQRLCSGRPPVAPLRATARASGKGAFNCTE